MKTAEPGRLRSGARVLASADGRLTVQSTPASGCPRCDRGEGCGQALWGSRQQPVQLSLAGEPLPADTRVQLELPASRLLRAAWLAYGVPLAGLLTGVAAAAALQAPEAGAVTAAVAGLLAGVLLARWLAARSAAALAPVLVGPDR